LSALDGFFEPLTSLVCHDVGYKQMDGPNLNLMPEELRPPKIPNLRIYDLPEPEQEAALLAATFLQEMYVWAERYSAAVLLRDSCANRISPTNMPGEIYFRSMWPMWGAIASRQAVFSARNYWVSLGKINIIHKAATWKAQIKSDLLSEARKEFESRFPNIVHVRHAVAHPEVVQKSGDVRFPMPTRPHASVQFSLNEAVTEQEFVTIWEGNEVACEVTPSAALFIRDNCDKAFSAVDAVTLQAEGRLSQESGSSTPPQ
jgi:hypothetical protein